MKLDRKQKIILTLIIIATAYLIWQIYSMFWGNADDSSSMAPAATIHTLPPTASTPRVTQQKVDLPTVKIVPTVPVQKPISQPIQPVMRQITIQAPLTPDQIEYMRLVGRYQILHMRRMLADEEAAMTAAQVKVAQLNQQISRLSGSFAVPTLAGQPSPLSPLGYQLMYIDYQGGKWTATLNKNSQIQEVLAGMILPDGVRVIKINQSGVVLQKNGRNYLVNFYGTTPIATSPVVMMKPVIKQTPVIAKSSKQVEIDSVKTARSRANNQKPPAHIETAPITTLQKSAVPVTTHPSKVVNVPPTLPKVEVHQENRNITVPVSEKPIDQSKPKLAVGSNVPIAPVRQPITLVPTHSVIAPAKTIEPSTKPLLTLTPQQKDTVAQLEDFLAKNKSTANKSPYTEDEKTLLGTPADRFTLQLIGSYKISDLTDFVQKQHLQQTYIFHTFYLDKDWYVLVYGIYVTEEQALQAIQLLSPEVQQVKPWVRSIASVQEAIKLAPKK